MFTRALDIGGSQTRIASNREDVKIIDSVFMETPLDMPIKSYIDAKKDDFIIVNSSRATIMQKRYAKGVTMNYY